MREGEATDPDIDTHPATTDREMHMTRTLPLLVAIAMLAALAPQASSSPTTLLVAYKDTLLAKDCDGFTALFSSTGVFFGPLGNAYAGHEAIDAFCQQSTALGKVSVYSYTDIVFNGDNAGLAKYLVTYAPAGTPMIATGHNTYFFSANASAPHGYLFDRVAGFADDVKFP